MRTRRARRKDVEAIARLIDAYARQGVLLPRAVEEIRAGIDRFVVLADGERILGCAALESYGQDLAEIRSLAIHPDGRGRGLGGRLLRAATQEARRRGHARVFAVTHAPDFFLQQGFQPIARRALSEKIQRDCRACPRRAHCRLTGVVAPVASRARELPVPGRETISTLAPGAAGNLS
jgi:amino-acid N-acetyltransferase